MDLGRYLSGLSPEEKSVRRAAFHAILDGKSPGPHEMARLTDMNIEDATAFIRDMARRGLLTTDGSGAVTGSGGLSLAPTGHRLVMNGRELYTWCAVDAVGIPAALGLDAEIVSGCKGCGGAIGIRMEKGLIKSREPSGLLIWLADHDPAKPVAGYT